LKLPNPKKWCHTFLLLTSKKLLRHTLAIFQSVLVFAAAVSVIKITNQTSCKYIIFLFF